MNKKFTHDEIIACESPNEHIKEEREFFVELLSSKMQKTFNFNPYETGYECPICWFENEKESNTMKKKEMLELKQKIEKEYADMKLKKFFKK